jgi:streptomycin 6-kinase
VHGAHDELMHGLLPDDRLRRRLGRRFGPAIDPWLDGLPAILEELAERWEMVPESLIQRGSMSAVVLCRTSDRRSAVLKACPDRRRIREEATALGRWRTPHVPAVLAFDEVSGALLIEAIEPGTPLAETPGHPRMEDLGSLMSALHAAEPASAHPPVTERITHLFDSGLKNYERRPDLMAVIPRDLYERGRVLAMRLAADSPASVLLHGDLTPVNVLDGGAERGLVAIDPAACLGDPAFDAVDFLSWRAQDLDTVVVRAQRLAQATQARTERLLGWCAAFAAMVALEAAEEGEASDATDERVRFLVELARAET